MVDVIPEIYKVRDLERSFLATMPYPNGDDELPAELGGLKDLGVDILVSLLEPAESEALGLSRTESLAADLALEFLSYPLTDHDVPPDPQEFANLAFDLSDRLQLGSSVAVHCVGGIGRSTLLAAAIMVDLGDDPRTLFERISSVRGYPVPDTAEQIDWFFDVCELFNARRVNEAPRFR